MLVGKCIPASPAVCFWRNGVQKEYEEDELLGLLRKERGKD